MPPTKQPTEAPTGGDTRTHVDTPPTGLTLADAARLLGITKQALRKRIERGNVTANLIEGRWYVYLDESPTKPPTLPRLVGGDTGEVERLRREVEELRADRDAWRAVALSQAEALRALPAPEPAPAAEEHRPWWKVKLW